MLEATKAFLLKLWNDQDVQLMVLISLLVQVFLLFTGNLRRWRRSSGLLRLMIWLAYVGADAVAVFAIGLLSQYEEKYKLRSQQLTEDHTLPFLWAPFLLLHLGGQDTITAFSMEDNNLWHRHLLNLVIQVALTLYAFWKSFGLLDSQLLAIAAPIFVAGIIKYGERTWALYSASREYLGSCSSNKEGALPDYRSTRSSCGDAVASYALNTVLRVRGLFVGRTLFQLGKDIEKELVHDFVEHVPREGRVKVVMAELGMMYDLLYTKAMVLQSRAGRMSRCVAETAMVAAFVLFLTDHHQLHARYNRADLIITYTLFAGALFTGACSVSMAIVSPWTRARLKKGTFLLWLSCSACSLLNAIKTQQPQQMSIGQFNLADYSMCQLRRRPKLISRCVSALGLEKQERDILHVKHVKDKQGISAYIGGLYGSGEGSQGQLGLGKALIYALKMPFEHALFRLHIYTDLYVSSMELDQEGEEVALVAAECMTITNYMMHLMLNCPSMLPVGCAAQDLESTFTEWVSDNCSGTIIPMTKREILDKYTREVLSNEADSVSPFASLPQGDDVASSLRTIKETWARLLIYAAGKCPMEMHARQLSNGVELITLLSLLMLQHGEGDAGKREVGLFTSSDDPHPAGAVSLVSVDNASWRARLYGPHYAFEFGHHSLSVAPWVLPQSEEELIEQHVIEQTNLHDLDHFFQQLQQFTSQPGDTSSETRVGSEMEQQQAQAALEDDTPSETNVGSEMEQQHHAALEGDASLESNAGSEMEQQQANVTLEAEQLVTVIDVAALALALALALAPAPAPAPEIDQVVDAAFNTEQADYTALETEHTGESGNSRPI